MGMASWHWISLRLVDRKTGQGAVYPARVEGRAPHLIGTGGTEVVTPREDDPISLGRPSDLDDLVVVDAGTPVPTTAPPSPSIPAQAGPVLTAISGVREEYAFASDRKFALTQFLIGKQRG